MLISSVLLIASANAPTCDLRSIATARSVHDALSHRAVEIVMLASGSDTDADARLNMLIAPSASFDLGAGDVGRPLGNGIRGARALAETMNADHYRYLGWDYMDGPADACANHKIIVEFSNEKSGVQSKVEFAFSDGVVVAVSGWQRSFEAGAMPRSASTPTSD